ncbi:hypothetical protein CLU79DRAFT_883873 [Phycomyces nitens]|nr:hypothetical protein CLU79DRAFT_883873 [Phycomyces nitens]
MQLPSLGGIAVSNIFVNGISTAGHSNRNSLNIVLNHRVKLHEVTSFQSVGDLPWYDGHSCGGVVLPMDWLREPASRSRFFLNGRVTLLLNSAVCPPLKARVLVTSKNMRCSLHQQGHISGAEAGYSIGVVLIHQNRNDRKVVSKWKVGHAIKGFEYWPAQSLDFNPIGHVWLVIKDSITEKKTCINNANNLKACISKKLEQIDPEFGTRLVASMPYRIKAVIAAHSGNSQY